MLAPIVPEPLETDHVKAGCVLIGFPNWSLAEAENCCAPTPARRAVAGADLDRARASGSR